MLVGLYRRRWLEKVLVRGTGENEVIERFVFRYRGDRVGGFEIIVVWG